MRAFGIVECRAGLLIAAFLLLASAEARAVDIGRSRDPVVMTGLSLSGFIGTDPSLIVAFR